MSVQDDTVYLRHRATEERRRAAASAQPEAQRIHLQLAEHYECRVQESVPALLKGVA